VWLVLGRLPLRYQVTVWILGLLSFAGLGAWLALTSDLPLLWPSATVASLALGAFAITLFLHLLEPEASRN